MKNLRLIKTVLFSVLAITGIFTTSSCQEETYTITWKNFDEEILEIDANVTKGSTPTYDGATPTRKSSFDTVYSFSSWSPEVVSVSKDAVYYATYKSEDRLYKVKWVNYDGTVLEEDNLSYGVIPSFDGNTPIKNKDDQYSYVFSSWSPEIKSVSEDATYTATFTNQVNIYDIVFKNYSGEVLQTSQLPYGAMPIYNGDTPYKYPDENGIYVFSSWYPSLSEVTKDITYTATFSSLGATFSDEDGFSYRLNNRWDGYIITSYSGSSEAPELKEEYMGQVIKGIGDYAFKNCTFITSINVPKSYFEIGYGAFSGCSGIQAMSLPFVGECLWKIDDVSSQFGYIFGEDSYEGGVRTVQYQGNYYLPSNLKSVAITGDTTIWSYAFYNCEGLESIIIISETTILESFSLYGCSSLKNIKIPNSQNFIEQYTFAYCNSLTSIDIPSTIEIINSYAFYYCKALESINISGQALYRIDRNAFCHCEGLKNITLPYGLLNLGDEAFSNCSSLISIELPNTIVSLGEFLFSNCSSLTSVTLPLNIDTIPAGLFYKCYSLSDIQNLSNFTTIKDNAFYNCSGLKNLVFSNYLSYIGNFAFQGCSSLESINNSKYIQYIGMFAFDQCYSFKSMLITSMAYFVADYAFSGCSSLKIFLESAEQTSRWSASWNEYGATVYIYSETMPNTSGNYWHYVSGEITIW